MKITQDNNFCRVLELPDKFPNDFCFGGGHLVGVIHIDWFNPIPQDHLHEGGKLKTWKEYEPMLLKFVKGKRYVRPGKRYVLITDFDEAIVFRG